MGPLQISVTKFLLLAQMLRVVSGRFFIHLRLSFIRLSTSEGLDGKSGRAQIVPARNKKARRLRAWMRGS